MTETGILNRDIAAELARMGHTDRLLIADAGLAIPDSTRVIDLSLAENVPTAVDHSEPGHPGCESQPRAGVQGMFST